MELAAFNADFVRGGEFIAPDVIGTLAINRLVLAVNLVEGVEKGDIISGGGATIIFFLWWGCVIT